MDALTAHSTHKHASNINAHHAHTGIHSLLRYVVPWAHRAERFVYVINSALSLILITRRNSRFVENRRVPRGSRRSSRCPLHTQTTLQYPDVFTDHAGQRGFARAISSSEHPCFQKTLDRGKQRQYYRGHCKHHKKRNKHRDNECVVQGHHTGSLEFDRASAT